MHVHVGAMPLHYCLFLWQRTLIIASTEARSLHKHGGRTMFDATLWLGCYAVGTLFLMVETLTISGIASYEVRDLREDFARVDSFLVPRVIAAARPWRHVLRIAPLVLINVLWGYFLVFGLGLEADERLIGALGGILALEWLVMAVVRRINARKYREDIEECKLLAHPDNLRVLGCLQDRSPPDAYNFNPDELGPGRSFRAGHVVRGGRLITVVTETDRVMLFLPLAFYGPRPVEETDAPVVVFYQHWSKSGLAKDHDCEQAIGVYVGFRPNPTLNVEADVSTEEAVILNQVLADNGEKP